MSITIAKWTIPFQGRYTTEQYHELVATGILDDRRVELLAGDIVEMPPAGMAHAVYCGRTVEYLRSLLTDRANVRETHPITLPNNSEPEPDCPQKLPHQTPCDGCYRFAPRCNRAG